MESIRILQNTYVNLYVLAKPIRDFLQEKLPLVQKDWHWLVDDILQKTLHKYDSADFEKLDIYYYLKILLYKDVWFVLKKEFHGNWTENKNLLYGILKIRDAISHPSLTIYTKDDYDSWTSEIESAARLFGAEFSELKSELYNSEKEKLLNLILSKVVNPALENPNLSEKMKESIKNTQERLEQQNSAQGIVFFFQDSLNSLRGKEIKEEFHKHNLLAFEDIKDEVENLYFN